MKMYSVLADKMLNLEQESYEKFRKPVEKLCLGFVGIFNSDVERASYLLNVILSRRSKEDRIVLMGIFISFMNRLEYSTLPLGLVPMNSVRTHDPEIIRTLSKEVGDSAVTLFASLQKDYNSILQAAGKVLDWLEELRKSDASKASMDIGFALFMGYYVKRLVKETDHFLSQFVSSFEKGREKSLQDLSGRAVFYN